MDLKIKDAERIEFETIEENHVENRSLTYYGSRDELDIFLPSLFHPILVILGLPANIIVVTVGAGNRSMYTQANCYVFSIIISDFVVLSDVLINVFRRWFKHSLYVDGSYIDCVTLEASALTIVIFALERYIALCPLAAKPKKFSNGIKSVLVIWCVAATFPAMELNLNLHFLPGTQALIFLMSTTMVLLLPTFVILTLAAFALVDTRNLENKADRDVSKVFVALTVVFYVSMAPYRIVSLVRFMAPTFCCSQTMLNVSYLIVELSAAVNPILYGFVSNNFRTAFKETLRSFCAGRQRNEDRDP